MLKKCLGSLLPRIVLILGLTFTLTACPPQPPPSTLDELVSWNIEPLVHRHELVGAAVGVWKENQSAFFSFGEVKFGSGQRPTPNTVYEIGSITKTFTGILMGLAEEQGLLDDSMRMQNLLPASVAVPEYNGEPIRLWHLATHTSGLPRSPDNMNPQDKENPYADYTVDQMYAFLSSYSLNRTPGAAYEYSNLAAGLLGHILSLSTEKSYEELLISQICDPLNLPDTRITLNQDQQARMAAPYSKFFGLWPLRWPCPTHTWDLPALPGAGAIRSTVDDLIKYMQANIQPPNTDLGRAIKNAQQARFSVDAQLKVGLLWHIFMPEDGSPAFLIHNGETGGYRSFIGFYPDQNTGLIILSNTAYDFESVALTILSGLLKLPLDS